MLSTTEAKYIELSTGLRDLIPIRRLIAELAASLSLHRDEVSKVCTVWEDNNGALTMANAQFPSMTPRSKHIAVKYHWFREHLKKGEIEVKKIDTKFQKADIFTKGLLRAEYESKRKMLMGW